MWPVGLGRSDQEEVTLWVVQVWSGGGQRYVACRAGWRGVVRRECHGVSEQKKYLMCTCRVCHGLVRVCHSVSGCEEV